MSKVAGWGTTPDTAVQATIKVEGNGNVAIGSATVKLSKDNKDYACTEDTTTPGTYKSADELADGTYTVTVAAPTNSDYNDGTGTLNIKDGKADALTITLVQKVQATITVKEGITGVSGLTVKLSKEGTDYECTEEKDVAGTYKSDAKLADGTYTVTVTDSSGTYETGTSTLAITKGAAGTCEIILTKKTTPDAGGTGGTSEGTDEEQTPEGEETSN